MKNKSRQEMLELKAKLFNYIEFSETCHIPEEIKDEFCFLDSKGKPFFGKTFKEAVTNAAISEGWIKEGELKI